MDIIRLRPSNGIIKDKEGNTIALVWIFRPDTETKDQHWFESQQDGTKNYLCIETGSDKIPVNCKIAFPGSYGPEKWDYVGDEKVLKCFEYCCKLLSDKNMQHLGDQIIKDSILG
jgi:hypothetical protein